jgi:hypothetical protein
MVSFTPDLSKKKNPGEKHNHNNLHKDARDRDS